MSFFQTKKLNVHYVCNCFILNLTLIITVIYVSFANSYNLESIIPEAPRVNSKSYILMDYYSGTVLAEIKADIHREPASLTKIMTSYVIGQAIKKEEIKLNDIVIINNDAWATGNQIFKGSSLMFLKPGDHVLVSQLNRGIILQSGNDACVAMADYIAGYQDAFVGLMNNYVKMLGLQNTHFNNVHGLDSLGQFTSARDIALISQALIHDVPDEYAFYKEKEFTFNNIRQLNRNKLLWDTNLNVDGIKTGHTEAAGYNLAASATKGSMRLISVVLGSNSIADRENSTRKLLTWGFRFFETIKFAKANKNLISKPIWFGNKDNIRLGTNQDIYLTIPCGRIKDVKVHYILNNYELHAPLSKMLQVGKIIFQLDDKILTQYPLITLEDISISSLFNYVLDYIKLTLYHLFN